MLLVWLPLLLPHSGMAVGDDAGREVLHEVRGVMGERYQTELPGTETGLTATPPPRSILPPFVSQILTVLSIIVVVVLVMNLFLQGGPLGGEKDSTSGADGTVPDFQRLQVPDPDMLAAQGLFAEAIHALLLRSLVLVSHSSGRDWPHSLTSREILRQGQLSRESRDGLRRLIQRVEVHHFGGLAPVESDFLRSREIFDGLSSSLREGPA